MKNLKLMKTILIIGTVLMIIFISGQVMAEDYKPLDDLTSAISGNNTTRNNTTGNNTASGNNTAANSLNSATNNTLKTNSTNTANTSSYNSTNLPKTGIGDSFVPVTILVVVFGISAAYAYRKIREYRNI